jgi:biopolymer transport protein TolR
VMLVLLVIFMVTAPLVTPGVIDLPTVGKAGQPKIVPLEVIVTEERKLSVRQRDALGRILSERDISRGDIAALIKANPDVPVLVAGDKNVRYEAVLQVMDELRSAGVRSIGLQVKPR